MMKKNMGAIDKTIRILVAIAIAVLLITKVISGIAAIVLIAVAAIFVLTSVMGFCPIYWSLGRSTNNKKQ